MKYIIAVILMVGSICCAAATFCSTRDGVTYCAGEDGLTVCSTNENGVTICA